MIGAILVAFRLVGLPLLIAGYIGDVLLMMPPRWVWRLCVGLTAAIWYGIGLWWSLS